MPKAVNLSFPLDGLFGLVKPSGPTSMSLLDQLKPLFRESSLFVTDETERKKYIEARKLGKVQRGRNRKFKDPVKMGQGGTLDPLADGVLVIGLNKGTKSLARFLDCSKEYYTTAILGCETNTYDSEGAVVRTAPYAHVTRESLTSALDAFKGEINQLPPIYSALKMDGKPLYEYARNGLPLPRPIDTRKVTVHSLELIDWQEASPPVSSSSLSPSNGHHYKWPTKRLTAEELAATQGIKKLINDASTVTPDASSGSVQNDDPAGLLLETPATASEAEAGAANNVAEDLHSPPIFTLKMTVSSGTYVRSIVHDLAQAVGSAAHVVSLSRTRQGEFTAARPPLDQEPELSVNTGEPGESTVPTNVAEGECIPWDIFQKAIVAREVKADFEVPEGEREDWEKLLLENLQTP